MNLGSEIIDFGIRNRCPRAQNGGPGGTLGPQGDVQKMREKNEVRRAHFWELFVLCFWMLFLSPNLMKNHVFSER